MTNIPKERTVEEMLTEFEEFSVAVFGSYRDEEVSWLREAIQAERQNVKEERDTYWKERVRKMIEDVRKDIPKVTREPFELAENVGKNIALDTLLDNLK